MCEGMKGAKGVYGEHWRMLGYKGSEEYDMKSEGYTKKRAQSIYMLRTLHGLYYGLHYQ